MVAMVQDRWFLALKLVLATVFLFAGAVKLIGTSAMIDAFAAIGFGQWFRYLTGLVEVVCAGLLMVPSAQRLAAFVLFCTMICAAAAQILYIGQSPLPAIILAAMCAVIIRRNRP